MEYENRLICFVDLLGFSEAIRQSVNEPGLAQALFNLLGEFREGGLEKAVYSVIPYLDKNGLSTCGEYYGSDLLTNSDPEYGMVATQFSDSFVISVPADNLVSGQLLIKALRAIHMHFFINVGMLMRGGIAIGPLVHQRGGALFGPAMNEAYALESKSAIYARVVVAKNAEERIIQAAEGANLSKAVFGGFDGFAAIDLVSLASCSDILSHADMGGQLDIVEQDILTTASFAHPKIAYLKSRWAQARDNWGFSKSPNQ